MGTYIALALCGSEYMEDLSRRHLLWTGLALSLRRRESVRPKAMQTYQLVTPQYEIRMTVQFYDHYASNSLRFRDNQTGKQHCYSPKGDDGRNCIQEFVGALAVAHYAIRARSDTGTLVTLREYVRTIDRDGRLTERPPFERALVLNHGIASDIQAFGSDNSSEGSDRETSGCEPWCLFRQELYLREDRQPFLLVHWKHTLSAIRILDLIPGERTKLLTSQEV